MRLRITHNGTALASILAAMPAETRKAVGQAISRSAIEMSRDARRRVPKARSELVNAIRKQQLSPLIHEIVADKRYAVHVENGALFGGLPSMEGMLDWIRVKGIVARHPAVRNDRDLAWMIRRSIALRGTPKQPYLIPAVEEGQPKLFERIATALEGAMSEPKA